MKNLIAFIKGLFKRKDKKYDTSILDKKRYKKRKVATFFGGPFGGFFIDTESFYPLRNKKKVI